MVKTVMTIALYTFVALRALVREIIPNTIHTYIHTHMTEVGFNRLFDSSFAPSPRSIRLNKQSIV